jgi:hypothetical protein
MTRGVLGEQLWTQARPKDLSLLLNVILAPMFVTALYMAYRRRFWQLMCFGGVALVLKLWFVDRMTCYYAEHGHSMQSNATTSAAPTE